MPTDQEIRNLPMSKAELKALFDFLDRPDPAPCTHTFKETESFLNERGLPKDKIIPWLQRNGAGCDCEVIFNTDAEWGEVVGRVPVNEDDEASPPAVAKKPWWKIW